jgi:SAM-dependent methyltransferase
MTLKNVLKRLKQYGLKGCIRKFFDKIKKPAQNDSVKDFHIIKSRFVNKKGLEIGGPSGAFTKNGYVPIYNIMESLDGVNFSDSTVWTGNIKTEHGFIIDGKNVGNIFIADAVDLSEITNNTYDFVLSSNNIEHIANPMKAIHQWILKLKPHSVLVIIAPRKESNFDHKREIVKFEHLLEDYNKNIDEHDLTHLEEILELHDLPMDPPAGNYEQFRERSLKNYENRCLHHHVFDLDVLERMCGYFNLKTLLKESKNSDYIIICEKP